MAVRYRGLNIGPRAWLNKESKRGHCIKAGPRILSSQLNEDIVIGNTTWKGVASKHPGLGGRRMGGISLKSSTFKLHHTRMCGLNSSYLLGLPDLKCRTEFTVTRIQSATGHWQQNMQIFFQAYRTLHLNAFIH